MKMGEDKVNSNAKVVNSNVFDLFKSLNSDDSTVNIDGSVQLLKYFAKDDVRSSYFNLKKKPFAAFTSKNTHIFVTGFDRTTPLRFETDRSRFGCIDMFIENGVLPHTGWNANTSIRCIIECR